MSGTNQPGDNLLVALQNDTAYVHVQGRGSFKNSTNLKQFGVAAIEADCRALVLDMAECMGMDSTFMGVLAGLAFRLKQRSQGDLLMVNLSTRTHGLLTTLGLDQVVRPYLAGATPPEYQRILSSSIFTLEALETEEESKRSTAETMLEAHQNLVDLTPENAPKFKDVLTFLREDLSKDDSDA
jgi:anti-anti-sigma factor